LKRGTQSECGGELEQHERDNRLTPKHVTAKGVRPRGVHIRCRSSGASSWWSIGPFRPRTHRDNRRRWLRAPDISESLRSTGGGDRKCRCGRCTRRSLLLNDRVSLRADDGGRSSDGRGDSKGDRTWATVPDAITHAGRSRLSENRHRGLLCHRGPPSIRWNTAAHCKYTAAHLRQDVRWSN
jgi:hypothetical protein